MKKIIRYLVIKLDIFVATICGFYVVCFNRVKVQNYIFCFHCVSSKRGGYESVTEDNLEKIRKFMLKKKLIFCR